MQREARVAEVCGDANISFVRHPAKRSVIAWLLDSDASIRWQVMRNLPDNPVAEAIELVKSKQDDEGRWPLEAQYPGVMPVQIDDNEGRPSRWNTLRALRVLNWYSAGE
jgi:hypothetical protein